MNHSLLLPVTLFGILTIPGVSNASDAIDHPGPGYRKQRELLDPPQLNRVQPAVTVSTVPTEIKSHGSLSLSSPADFSQPILLFPQSRPSFVIPLPSTPAPSK